MRQIEECPHRDDIRFEEGTEVAVCGLLKEISGLNDDSLCRTKRDACAACCAESPPTETSINSVIASHLFQLTRLLAAQPSRSLIEKGKLKELRGWAWRNLKSVCGSATKLRGVKEAGDCVFRGEHNGYRPCMTCRGNTRFKVYQCLHEGHEQTTILECQSCSDFEPCHTVRETQMMEQRGA